MLPYLIKLWPFKDGCHSFPFSLVLSFHSLFSFQGAIFRPLKSEINIHLYEYLFHPSTTRCQISAIRPSFLQSVVRSLPSVVCFGGLKWTRTCWVAYVNFVDESVVFTLFVLVSSFPKFVFCNLFLTRRGAKGYIFYIPERQQRS